MLPVVNGLANGGTNILLTMTHILAKPGRVGKRLYRLPTRNMA